MAAAIKAFATHDGAVFEESYNLLNAWLATMPGNAAHNLRRLALLNTNCADLAFLFAPRAGERTSEHLGGECLAVFETEHQTPYHWNLHYGDVGHALVLGATGSGKSFLLNFILTHAQQYDPSPFIFDLGGSYEKLTRRLGGTHVAHGPPRPAGLDQSVQPAADRRAPPLPVRVRARAAAERRPVPADRAG